VSTSFNIAAADDVRVPGHAESLRVIDVTDAIIAAETPRTVAGKRAGHYYARIGALLVLLDVLCLTAALLSAHMLRFGFLPTRDYWSGLAVAPLLWVGVFYGLGLYRPQHLAKLEELRRTVSAAVVGVVTVILLTFWFDVFLSRAWMALTLVIALTLELVSRGSISLYVSRLQAREKLVLRTLVIGSGEHAEELMEGLNSQGSGFVPLGYVDAMSPLMASEELSPAKRIERLRAIIREHDPDCVFVASPTIGPKQMFAVMQAARQEGVTVRVYTHLFGILTSRISVQPVGKEGVALTLKPAHLSASQRVLKRGMDLFVATLGLIASSPLLLVIALAVKVTSRGPILYLQERVTMGGRTFRMYKFRTMSNDADSYVQDQAIDTSVPFFKLKSDPRLTKVGKWLRRLSLDELPQLFNVLGGDMSLVGPRPLPAEQVAANLELLGPRLEVRAGVTGWWQIQGRSDVDAEEAARMDLFYIENWSPSLDLYILLRTVGVLLGRKGAY
jgi:exopolysaccharide biosynthesis polyprenyl glycosylphosphotransferase